MRFKDKVCIVTGAGSGIGEAIARAFAGEGAKVVVSDEHADEVAAVVDAIRNGGGKSAFGFPGDVTDEAKMEEMIKSTLALWGRIDILVNSAGKSQTTESVLEQSMDEWDALMNVHLKAPYLLSRLVAPVMIQGGGGSIINISSIAGIAGFPRRTAYGPAKAAIIMLTKILALEWASSGIRVNAVVPGYIETPMVREFIRTGHAEADRLKSRIPLGRLGTPDEVSAAVLFLASEDARYITGASLVIDGGWVAYGWV